MVLEAEPVPGLGAMLDGLRDAAKDWPYTVGWIDCLARGAALGRGILIRGRHATRAEAPAGPPPVRAHPGAAGRARVAAEPGPDARLQRRVLPETLGGAGGTRRPVPYHGFFYPLDAIGSWNRLYGRRGFLQYQCVVPRAAGAPAVAELLERLAAAGAASFLAVIKDCGPESDAYLSFPLEGTTLALDLPYRGAAHRGPRPRAERDGDRGGGRVYLAKDAVTRAEDFALHGAASRRVAAGPREVGSRSTASAPPSRYGVLGDTP